MKKILLFFIAVLIISLIWVAFFWSPEKQDALFSTERQEIGGNFILQSAKGEVSLNDFSGKLVLIYFGYTWCPDVCPTNLSIMSSTLSQLNEQESAQVQGLFISVDPGRDSVKRLSSYTSFFHKNILGLTGTKQQIDDLTKRYGVSYRLVKQDSATDYVVDHSSITYLVGKNGNLLESLAHATPAEKILQSIKKHL